MGYGFNCSRKSYFVKDYLFIQENIYFIFLNEKSCLKSRIENIYVCECMDGGVISIMFFFINFINFLYRVCSIFVIRGIKVVRKKKWE